MFKNLWNVVLGPRSLEPEVVQWSSGALGHSRGEEGGRGITTSL